MTSNLPLISTSIKGLHSVDQQSLIILGLKS